MEPTSKRVQGAIALGDVAEKAGYLDMACTRCDRKGRYETARLVRKFGVDFPMTELAGSMSRCPKKGNQAAHERCDVYFPGLLELMYPEVVRPTENRTD